MCKAFRNNSLPLKKHKIMQQELIKSQYFDAQQFQI